MKLINPVLRGWVNYFAVGHASECFGFVKDWVETKIRRHMLRARNRQGFGWARWSRGWLYQNSEAVRWLPSDSTSAESRSGRIGPIILEAKQTGERSAGNPHAAFDEAGAGNVARPRWCDTRRRKSEPTGNTNFGLNRRVSPRPYLLACSAGERPAGERVRSPVVWIAGWRETKTLKPIDNVSLGKATSHRAVTTVNAKVASKVRSPEGRAPTGGRRQHGEPKSDRCGSFTSAGWKRQHGGKDMPSNWRSPPRPGAKSPEQGRSYNRLNREVDRRREGDGWVRNSVEAG